MVTPPGRRATPARRAPSAWVSAIVGAVALLVHLALVPGVPADRDGGEFVLVLATLGTAHPTGYPLYTLLGHAFVLAAHALGGSWAWSANAFSALAGALALALMHALAARLLARSLSARAASLTALLPVLAFAGNPAWLADATTAEVNSAHLAWVFGAGLAAAALLRAIERPEAASGRAAAAWGFVLVAGLAHHATSVLFSAPLTLALLLAARSRPVPRGRWLAALAMGALPALLSLAYVPWRAFHPAAAQWPELAPTLAGVFDHVVGSQFRGYLGRYAPDASQLGLLARYIYPWLTVAIAGALLTMRRPGSDRPLRAALGAGVLVQTAYAFSYGVPDPASYFLPAIGVGLVLLASELAALAPVRRAAVVGLPLAALALVLLGAAGVGVIAGRNQALVQLDALLRGMWNAVPDQPSFLVWDDDMIWRLRASQLLEGSKPRVELVQPSWLTQPWPRKVFTRAHGFDPLADLPAGALADAGLASHPGEDPRTLVIAEAINRHTRLPVLVFMPRVPSVRLLDKPGATRPGAPPSGAP
jgi:hypothetical protein